LFTLRQRHLISNDDSSLKYGGAVLYHDHVLQTPLDGMAFTNTCITISFPLASVL